MKTKTLLTLLITLGFCAVSRAQDGSGGIGVGVGVGVGVGTGVGANVQILRVPGQIMQGRRVYSALVVAGSTASTNGPTWSSTSFGPAPIPRGYGAGWAGSVTKWFKEYSTTITVYNPGTNAVNFTWLGTSTPLGPRQSYTINPSQAGVPIGGPGSGLSTRFLAIESQSPLEVAALYEYHDERLDFSSESWIETAIGALFGP